MKKRLFFLPMVAIMMAACSSNETIEVNENKGDLISFRPIVKGVTRAADVNTDNLASFVVNAKKSGEETSYFDNGVFNKSGSVFVSESKYYWPASGPLDFYAYSPSGNAQVNYSGYKTFTVTPSTTIADQVDFVFAATKEKDKASCGASGVTLNFRHTGAKIACNVKNSSTTLKFDVYGWKVGYICPAATFTFSDANTDGNNDGSGTTLTLGQWDSRTAASIDTEYESTFSVNQIGQSGATSLDGQMILIPQAITAASGYASGSVGANLNGTYIAVKLKIRNNDSAGTIIADDGADGAFWAIWPIGGYNWEPGKKYTYTIDLAGGGYYETNQDADADLDPILEGAEIKFVSVSVDGWTQEVKGQAPINLADLGSIVDMGADCSSYIGWIVTSDGYIYKDKASVDAVSKTGVAMIAYLGSETGESAPYNHGLAISLVNANGGTVSAEGEECQWKNVPLDDLTAFENLVQWNYDFTKLSQFTVSESGLQYISRSADATTYPAFAAAASNNGALPPYGSSGWFLPSIWQWEKMYYSFGNGKSYLRDAFASRGGRNLYAYRYQSGYWSCSETDWDPRKAWLINFFSGLSECGKEYKSGAHGYVRSIVAF